MKKLSMTEGKWIGLLWLWVMSGIATVPLLGSALLTGAMAHIAYGVCIMQSVNVLFLKERSDKNDWINSYKYFSWNRLRSLSNVY